MQKRISYIKQLEADLIIANEHNREDLANSIIATINKYKEYKHNWYLNSKSKTRIIQGKNA